MQEATDTTILLMLLERGEMVIAAVTQDPASETLFVFDTPALVIHERQAHGILGFMLTPWIPNELVQGPVIRVTPGIMRGTLLPTPELVSFYKTWARTEREKLRLFAKEFNAQVGQIEKFHIEKFEHTKDRKSRETFVNPNALPDTLIALFEEDTEWGDPSITH
jgi:hypothetical protein